MILNIGLDDIDTPTGGCTTHLGYIIALKLRSKFGDRIFIDYPYLVRLNPNIPWKTRGNGAVALKVNVPNTYYIEYIKKMVIDEFKEYTKLSHPTRQPAIAFHMGYVNPRLTRFYYKALRDVVTKDLLKEVILECNIEYYTLSGKVERGLIGAIAAIGVDFSQDFTFELIAYRSKDYIGLRERLVDVESVFYVEEKFKSTFLNVDYETKRVLITPRGPDPVLFGIRGVNPIDLVEVLKYIKTYEPIAGWIIYKSNQATDVHLSFKERIADVRPYQSVIVEGIVRCKPRRIPGGHVVFTIGDSSGSIDCIAYEQTGRLRDVVEGLIIGDRVRVYGGVRPPSSKHGLTLNIEKIEIIELAPLIKYSNPKCPVCGKTMKSAGRNKGYKCPKCGYRDPKAEKVKKVLERTIKPGIYYPPPRTFKHLMKPPQRPQPNKNQIPPPTQTKWIHP